MNGSTQRRPLHANLPGFSQNATEMEHKHKPGSWADDVGEHMCGGKDGVVLKAALLRSRAKAARLSATYQFVQYRSAGLGQFLSKFLANEWAGFRMAWWGEIKTTQSETTMSRFAILLFAVAIVGLPGCGGVARQAAKVKPFAQAGRAGANQAVPAKAALAKPMPVALAKPMPAAQENKLLDHTMNAADLADLADKAYSAYQDSVRRSGKKDKGDR